MRVLCPSKTFLVGEYAVLSGFPAILLATPPYFSRDEEGFFDPYDGQGGFGASGAEFVIDAKKQGIIDPWLLLKNYKNTHAGSGADVMCQWTGGVTYFFAREKILEKIIWPFENLVVGLIHTGFKIKTHEHLEKLTQQDFSGLEQIVHESYQALKNPDQAKFIQSISDYYHALFKLTLVAETTKDLIQKLQESEINKKHNIILASKGCGAMGADVVLVILEKNHKEIFETYCKAEKLNLVFCDNQFADGIKEVTLL